jgi:acetoacetyl-CoA synthetase
MHDQAKITRPEWSDLYRWSITDVSDFWACLSRFLDVKFQCPAPKAFTAGKTMREALWFAGATLNFSENLLPLPDGREVLVGISEGAERSSWTGLELWNDVARCAGALRSFGIKADDRVAGVLVNGPEAVIGMLAAASIGAIWTSCSPDFGTRGISDRLSQVSPKIVFATAKYFYNGKEINCRQQIHDAVNSLSPRPEMILVDHLNPGKDPFSDFLATSRLPESSKTALPIEFAARSFHDPLYILFSSGTTGLPKCITHGVGGTLLQHKKELMLHSDIKPEDTLLYFTTCGWMMWNWMVSALGCGARVITFDGAPTFPTASRLWDLCREESVTHFGTSPKFISACAQDPEGIPTKSGELPSLRVILSTGAPLLPAHYEWVYNYFYDVHLSSISGGTDIISCFMLGNPLLPVYAGEIQAAGLGMAIEGWDEDQRPVTHQKSELVCVKPFVSMPVCFWNDPNGERYHKAYFDHYPMIDVWRHGDFVEFTDRGGVIVYGRSDATLNPGGVRIGTAEIYRAVETLPFVADSLAVGQVVGDDTRVVLFVKLATGRKWLPEMAQEIKLKIRSELTPRHVPATIFPVRDIPYTRSGKKVEIAVTQVIHREDVPNKSALANPESLVEYEGLLAKLWA